MFNNYEAPEVVEMGETKDVILGVPKQTDRWDSAAQDFVLDPDMAADE